MDQQEITKAFEYLNKLDERDIPHLDKSCLKRLSLISKTNHYSNYYYENSFNEKLYVREYQNVKTLEDIEGIIEEIIYVYNYKHRNIHELNGYDIEKVQKENTYAVNIYLIFEEIDNELEDQLIDNSAYFTPDIIKKIGHHILMACYYLNHEEQYHSNINPRNIVIINGNFKLSSLAAARFLPSNKDVIYGNTEYFSPELFETYVHAKKNKTDPSKNDVYSLGLTLMYIASHGEIEGKNSKYNVFDPEGENMKATKQILANNKDIPTSFGHMLEIMLKYNPIERPNIYDLSSILTQNSQYLEFTELEDGAQIRALPFQPQKGYEDGQYYDRAKKLNNKKPASTPRRENSIQLEPNILEINTNTKEKEANISKILSYNPSLEKIIKKAAEIEKSTIFKKLGFFKENIKDIKDIDDLRNAIKEGNLSGLNIFYAYKNKTDEDLIKITNLLKYKQGLHEFKADFIGNEFTEEALVPFLKTFQIYWGLQVLELDFSKGKTSITDQILIEFTNSIAALKFIKCFTFKATDSPHKLTDKGLEALAQALKHLQLHELTIAIRGGKTQIKDGSMKALASLLQNQLNLKKLKLLMGEGLCEVTDDGFSVLSESLENMVFLEELNFQFYGGFNNMTDISIDKFAKMLENMAILEILELHIYDGENMIQDAGLRELSFHICKLLQLKCLKLYFYGGNNGVLKETHDEVQKQIKERYNNEFDFDFQVSIREEN